MSDDQSEAWVNGLSVEELSRLSQAGDSLIALLEEFALAGRSIIAELLSGAPAVEWEHYPPDDLFDPLSGLVTYYHAHAADDRPGEAGTHGHFHIFLDGALAPEGAVPLAAPGADDGSAPLCHLVAVSLDRLGIPVELFTTNQWVTGEHLYPAPVVSAMLVTAVNRVDPQAAPALRLAAGLVGLFRPQIDDLLAARDARLRPGVRGLKRRAADPRLEVTSALSIDIDRQLGAVEAALTQAEG